jgi:predicted nucleic acid-binding protein
MSRIFWDSMLFAYLLDNHPVYETRVLEILRRSVERGDSLFTSFLALGEIMAGAKKSPDPKKRPAVREAIQIMGFAFLPFDAGAVGPFSDIRATTRVKAADAIHLACAASAGVDLFLTGDKQLVKLNIPGIHFIVDFNLPIL